MVGNLEGHIDVVSFDSLKELMEDELPALIGTFLTDTGAKLAELEQAISAGDGKGLGEIAHGLKGSAGNVCTPLLAELAMELETIGNSGTVEGAEEVLVKLKAEFSIVSEILGREA